MSEFQFYMAMDNFVVVGIYPHEISRALYYDKQRRPVCVKHDASWSK